MELGRRGASTALLAVVVVVVIAVAAGAYFVFSPGLGSGTSSTTSSSAMTTETSSGSTTSTQSSSTNTTVTTSTSSTTMTPSTTTTSSSSTSSSSTNTCTTSTSTSSSAAADALNLTAMFSAFTSISVHFNGTFNGNHLDENSDYHVISKTAAGFKVNVTLASGATVVNYTDYVLSNGTAAAVTYSNYNYSGVYAQDLYVGSISAYYLANLFGSQGVLGQLLATGFVHATGNSTEMLGPTTVNVTNYAADSLPISESNCGSSSDFTKFSLQTGTVAGVSLTLLTSMDLAGSVTSPGASETLDMSLTVTSITKA